MMKRWIVALLFTLTGCAARPTGPRVIALGFDGCDPVLLERFIDQGKLPNFKRLKDMGGCWKLATTNPPQSPVAWATFNTGLGPGGHGIFDFIHRDPKTMKAVPSLTAIEGGHSVLLRDGRPFWAYLTDHKIQATLLKVPAHFPPSQDGASLLTGMGTPDLLGSYGTFTLYSEAAFAKQALQGGTQVRVEAVEGKIRASLIGPQEGSVGFAALVDAVEPVALLELPGQRRLLKEGEWTDWLPVQFPVARGIVRFYLKSVHPFQLYASPINIDPADPAQPISTPVSFSAHLCRCCGDFYTQGMAEDSKALAAGVLDDPAYLQQSQVVFQETERLLAQGLSEFHSGFFFSYLSSTDLQSHLYWNCLDPEHPGFKSERGQRYGKVIEETYQKADTLVGRVLEKADANTVVFVISDHGFAPFRRSFDLNAWLVQAGYFKTEPGRPLEGADWSHTQAYAVGFNGLYLNLAGREAHGLVQAADKEKLLQELTSKLLQLRDPQSGERVVVQVYRSSEIDAGPHLGQAPDLVVGYQRGYRASWETALGQTRGRLLEDNLDHWSGDHLMDPSVVPGVLLCSRKIHVADPHIRDLAPTFLGLFGIQAPRAMEGRNLLLLQ